MAVKKGLGRGVDTLLMTDNKKKKVTKETTNTGEKKENNEEIDILMVEPNSDQPRKKFDEDALFELSESIKQFGIIQPIVVQKKDKYYEIIAGERRWRAAKMAGLKKVPVVIRDYSEKEIVEIALIENIQREDLNPIEEALTYKKLIKEYSMKQDEVAERVGKSRAAITNSMRLLKLADSVQEMLVNDMISSGHARAILAIENNDKQYDCAIKIMDEKLSVRETEKLVKSIIEGKDKKNIKPKEIDYVYREIEEKLKESLGTKVSIKNKKNGKGKVEIEYYSQEALEKIIDLLK